MNKSIEMFILCLTFMYLLSFLYRDVDELGMDSYDKLRKEIAAKLDRTGHATVTKAVTHISRYPYHKIICAAGNIARQTSSGDHNQLIVSNNGWANTRSSSNAVATNDARTFGLRKGMVVAEISSTGAVRRY